MRVRAPVVVRTIGLLLDPMLPAAVVVRSATVIAVAVRVVRIEPADAVRVRLVVGKLMVAVRVMSPVVWVREREDEVMVAAR